VNQLKQLDETLFDLPFDQFSRQAHVRAIIEGSKEISGIRKYKILDVGGYKGATEAFHKNDDVVIADVQKVKDVKNYIELSGSALPFEDESFDIVVSFDTFEHIPQKDRKHFINELYRVSKRGVLLAAPFDDTAKNVSRAEVRLNDFHKKLYKKSHRWLKEHIEYVIPSASKLEKQLEDNSIPFVYMNTNELKIWTQLQMMLFSIELDTDLRGRIDDINRYYNRHLEKIDVQDEGRAYYRRIYLLWKDGSLRDSAATYMNRLKTRAVDLESEIELFAFASETMGIKYRDVVNHRDYLENEVVSRDETIKTLRNELESGFAHRVVKKMGNQRKKIIKRR